MEKIEITKRDLIFTGILFALASFFTVVWMALTGNLAQVCNDIVVEWTVSARSNKSAEIFLLRLLILLGALATVFFLKFSKKTSFSEENTNRIDSSTGILFWILCVILLKFLIFQSISNVLLFAFLLVSIVYTTDKKSAIPTFCLYFISYYFFFAFYQAGNFLRSYVMKENFWYLTSDAWAAVSLIFAVVCTSIPFLFNNKRNIIKKMILIGQLAVPALFLILSLKRYSYQGHTVLIGIPFASKILITTFIVLSFAESARLLRKFWNKTDASTSSIISIGTCIATACFNVYSGTGAIVIPDLHHPFENIFAFQQIFELGQIPFKDFIPPSGLYSVVQGFVFKLFGNGEFAYYQLCDNIFYFLIISATFILLKFHIKKIWCFATALFLLPPHYNRSCFMIVIVLLLLLPALVKRANLWLKVFLFVSVFHGLYYPVYGAAVFVGFIPMFAIQIKKLIKDGKKPYNNLSFWVSWGVVLLVILASVPLLWGTFLHIKAMAGQSILSDGISIFGQTLPDWFMPYSKLHNIFRYAFYNILHIVPLALIVWIPVLLLCKVLKADKSKNFFEANIEMMTTLISLVAMPLVSYLFSFMRVDIGTFFARSWSALICVILLYFIFLIKYTKRNFEMLFFVSVLAILIVPSNGIGVEHANWKNFSCFTVPENYVISSEPSHNIGKCFLRQDLQNFFVHENNDFSKSKKEYFGNYGFAYWYIFEKPGAANMESTSTSRGFNAAKETRKMLLNHKAYVGTVDPLVTYYLFNWLVSSGEYIWDSENGCFVFNDENTLEEARTANLKCPMFYENYNLGNSADVFGLSYKSLKKIFTKQNFEYELQQSDFDTLVHFQNQVTGSDMDFIYLEFEDIKNSYITTEFDMSGEHEAKPASKLVKKLFLKTKPNPKMQVQISFFDDSGAKHSVFCNYGNGKLLINIGVGYKYLLSNHSKIEISVLNDGSQTEIPKIKKVDFLKCRKIY